MRLTGNRYAEIEDEVIKMYSGITIKSFPIDCFEICEQLGIVYIPYSSLSFKKKEALGIGSQDGLHALWEMSKGNFVFIIYYNDNLPPRRIRFTIMHELGHFLIIRNTVTLPRAKQTILLNTHLLHHHQFTNQKLRIMQNLPIDLTSAMNVLTIA